MRGGQTRRVRYVAEWVVEVPADQALELGDRVTPPTEMAVRQTHEKDVRVKGQKVDTDLVAVLAPHLVTPGSTWRVRCSVHEGWTSDWDRTGATRPAELELEAETLSDALNALVDFAGEQVAKRPWCADQGNLRGWASVAAVEPGEAQYSGWSEGAWLQADFGGHSVGATLDQFLTALDGLCDDAERLFAENREAEPS